MAHILVTGANGQLGNEFRRLAAVCPDHVFLFTDVQELDICDREAVIEFLKNNPVGYVVNCAAYTAVEKAEDEPDRCYRINRDAVGNLAEAARKTGSGIIHISTDYVYSGENFQPYIETDPTAPRSVYGSSKLEGERVLFENCPQASVIRTSWLYSGYGSNFVKTMIRLGQEKEKLNVVFDQIGSPTYAADLAGTILQMIGQYPDPAKLPAGIYNYSDEGVCSWYDFAKAIHRLAGITGCRIEPVVSAEYPARVTRPFYSVMNKTKIRRTFAVGIPYWEESLQRCVAQLMK